MDAGLRLERALRHLKNNEPKLEQWQTFGDIRSTTVAEGVPLNGRALEKDTDQMIAGLVLAVHLLAKKCAALEKEISAKAL
jgi:hypothetical protein